MKDFTDSHLGRVVVTHSSFQAEVMVQTEHFTMGGNHDGNVKEEKLHWLPIPTFLLKKKKKKNYSYSCIKY
jgi:hypothetical protein